MATSSAAKLTRDQRRVRARAERRAREAAEHEAARRRRRWMQLAAVAAVAVALVAGMIALSLAGVEERAPKDGQALAGASELAQRFAGIPQDGAALGDPKAPLTLVEFADLQCPWCARWDRDVLPAVLERVRRGELRIVLRPLRFLGPDSVEAAALAGAAAGQDRLWQLVDLFYRNQGAENSGYVTEAFQRRLAAAVPGLDRKALLATRSTSAAARLAEVAEREATAAGIRSTPSFLVGRTGAPPQVLDAGTFEPDAFLAALDRAVRR